MGIATASLKSLPDTERSFSVMLDRYKRHLGYVGLGILATGAGTWFYLRSKALKEQHAEMAFRSAMQSVLAGNIPLARSDLKKMSLRYSGTAAGAEGAMELAKLDYTQGSYQQGIDALQPAPDGPDFMKFDVYLLRAAGYEGLNRSTDAAREYETAAKIARFAGDRDRAKANAARNYTAAGNKGAAVKIWTDLLNDSKSFMAEAKIRLGELEAQPSRTS